MDFKGLITVVTGASSGFGREIAHALASRGATVVAVARREERLKELISELGEEPHWYFVADVTQLDDIRALVKAIEEKEGHVDILINNAGIASKGPIAKATSEELEQVIKTNLVSAIWCTRELLRLLEAAPRKGRTPLVMNVASMAGRIPTPKSADYAASKFGLVGFTESLWHEMSERRIRTMLVEPGFFDTEGFPMDALKSNPATAWTVMDASRVVRAAVNGIEKGSFEVRVQWWYHPLYHATVMMGPLRRFISGPVRQLFGNVGKF